MSVHHMTWFRAKSPMIPTLILAVVFLQFLIRL